MSEETALQVAVRFLARREHSQGELEKKLAQRDFDEQQIAKALLQLADQGLQSDQRFAEMFVRSKTQQGQGPVRIRSELVQRGVAASVIDAAFAEAQCDWLALADTVYRRRFGSDVAGSFQEKAKRMRFLQYRGFTTDMIQQLMEKNGTR